MEQTTKIEETPPTTPPRESIAEIQKKVRPKKKKTGRPKGTTKEALEKRREKQAEEEAAPAPGLELSTMSTAELLKAASRFCAKNWGAHWEMPDEDAKTGALVVNNLAMKHSHRAAAYAEEIAAAVWACGYVLPRLLKTLDERAAARAKEESQPKEK